MLIVSIVAICMIADKVVLVILLKVKAILTIRHRADGRVKSIYRF